MPDLWFDPEGDFLEVQFSDAPGFMREPAHDALIERVDEHGPVIGFSILGVDQLSANGLGKRLG